MLRHMASNPARIEFVPITVMALPLLPGEGMKPAASIVVDQSQLDSQNKRQHTKSNLTPPDRTPSPLRSKSNFLSVTLSTFSFFGVSFVYIVVADLVSWLLLFRALLWKHRRDVESSQVQGA